MIGQYEIVKAYECSEPTVGHEYRVLVLRRDWWLWFGREEVYFLKNGLSWRDERTGKRINGYKDMALYDLWELALFKQLVEERD